MSLTFRTVASKAAEALGSPAMFLANVVLVVVWLALGPVFHFSSAWQVFLPTVTTVFTYLAVFLLQNTQNRDSKAMHVKLDELISSTEGARNRLVNLQDLSDEEVDALRKQFARLGQATADARAIRGEPDVEGG